MLHYYIFCGYFIILIPGKNTCIKWDTADMKNKAVEVTVSRSWEVKDDLSDRLLGDTVHAPISQCSCEDTDWHRSPCRSAPCPHSVHLGNKKKKSLLYYFFITEQIEHATGLPVCSHWDTSISKHRHTWAESCVTALALCLLALTLGPRIRS